MQVLIVLMWAIGLLFAGGVVACFFGALMLETDAIKANRLLADLHDKHAAR